jgi:hypothetical protein
MLRIIENKIWRRISRPKSAMMKITTLRICTLYFSLWSVLLFTSILCYFLLWFIFTFYVGSVLLLLWFYFTFYLRSTLLFGLNLLWF